ncbi:serine hydrolase domain-containing protein [Streptomyces sp. NPDC101249]|uniref:serine hydrolase domain-containing protein n=1 Tax=unclassified Streptomyces TaxID=2593676 RepID=UPI0037F848FA
MSARPLPVAAPAAQGVDATRVLAFLDAVEAAPGLEPHSLMILRHGHLVASGWWAPYTEHRPHLLYSLSKSFTATAAGIAAGEGLLDLDDTVLSYFPELDGDITDPRSRAMRVRHVAAMATGHEDETWGRARDHDRDDVVRGFLLVPPEREPGTVFAYNQPATYTLGAIVQRVTGQSLTAYLRPRLLDPLGVGGTAWLRDRSGREIGFSGLYAATDAVARLGELYLRDGVWQGERLLPEGWVADATRPHITTDDAPAAWLAGDGLHGYGYQFWRSRHGYRGDGAYGQFCLVLPGQDAVVATTAAAENAQLLLDLAWEHLVPAFGPAPLTGRDADDSALARRLARLELPPADGKPAPPEREQDWDGAEFTPRDGTCPAQPGLTSVTVTRDADGWTLVLTEGGHRTEAPLPRAGWGVTDGPPPIAVSGGWSDPGTLAADLAFLETPHRLTLTCSLPERTFTARWITTPLDGAPLRALRAPRQERSA